MWASPPSNATHLWLPILAADTLPRGTLCRYSQTEIAGIGTACNVGGYFALFAGLFFDKLKVYDRCVALSAWTVADEETHQTSPSTCTC